MILLSFGIVTGYNTSAAAQTQQKKNTNIIDPTKFRNVMDHCEKANTPLACLMIANHYSAIAQSKGQYDDKRRIFLGKACLAKPHQGKNLELDRDIVGLACRGAGEMLQSGMGGPKNLKTSSEYFLRSCGFNNMIGCAHLGEAYETGRGLTKNKDAAIAAFKKSCSDSLPVACYRSVRMIFWDALNNKNAPNNQRFALARSQSDVACNAKWSTQISSCWYRGFFMAEPRGGPANPAAALKAYYVTCQNSKKENGLNACFSIARIRLEGPQNLRNKAEAKKLLTAGCAAKYQLSCDYLKKVT